MTTTKSAGRMCVEVDSSLFKNTENMNILLILVRKNMIQYPSHCQENVESDSTNHVCACRIFIKQCGTFRRHLIRRGFLCAKCENYKTKHFRGWRDDREPVARNTERDERLKSGLVPVASTHSNRLWETDHMQSANFNRQSSNEVQRGREESRAFTTSSSKQDNRRQQIVQDTKSKSRRMDS